DADDVRRPAPDRHKVDEADGTARDLDVRLQNESLRAVAARRANRTLDGVDRPPSVVALAQQGREARAGIESRKTRPVDGSAPRHQGSGLRVADHRVVLDSRRGHRLKAKASRRGTSTGSRLPEQGARVPAIAHSAEGRSAPSVALALHG